MSISLNLNKMNVNKLADIENQDLTSNSQISDSNIDKHQRFNLRKLNLPPLKRDHSRSLDLSRRGGKNKMEFKRNL